jgi:hypothetical protein
MSNSNWDDSNLPRPPVPSPAPRPVARAWAEVVEDLAIEVAVGTFQEQLDHCDHCLQCRAWVFGDGLQCELHPDD